MKRYRVAGPAVVVLAAAVLTGCATNTTTLPNLDGPRLTGAPGVLKSPEQQATEQATDMLNRFYDLLTRVSSGGADPNELAGMAMPPYLDQIRREVDSLRVPDVVVTGKVRVAAAEPTKVVAPQDAEKAPIPGEALVELRVCEDRSQLKVAGPAPGQPPQTRLRRYQLVNGAWPGAGWMIARQYVVAPDTGCDKPY